MAIEGTYQEQITVADLCQALADGCLPATLGDGYYEVCVADLRRLRHVGRSRRAPPDPAALPASLLDYSDAGQLHYSA